MPSKAIGGKVMTKLKKLDGVAYVRFASVIGVSMTQPSFWRRSRNWENPG
ncbi:MAG: hypothetical protein Ct9H300mP32_6450 [Verrucomicrobiota bacterium]|nr:MAG: hypothetical protein Ct9H300mP32_6450 [Verrucomicrobiota bacterium]